MTDEWETTSTSETQFSYLKPIDNGYAVYDKKDNQIWGYFTNPFEAQRFMTDYLTTPTPESSKEQLLLKVLDYNGSLVPL